MNSTQSAVMRDGPVVSGWPEHVARAVAIDRQMADDERRWLAGLREQGVKAAHPDDGWVNREANKVHLCYPQFNDGLVVGELLALGWPDRHRIVRVIGTSNNRFGIEPGPWWFHFEEASACP